MGFNKEHYRQNSQVNDRLEKDFAIPNTNNTFMSPLGSTWNSKSSRKKDSKPNYFFKGGKNINRQFTENE